MLGKLIFSIKRMTTMNFTPKLLKQSGIGLATLAVLVTPVAVSAAVDTASTVINATVGSTITVSSASPVTLNLTPGTSPTLSTASDTVTVSTNNSTGYVLSLANADANTSLVSGANTIAAHTAPSTTPTVLAENRWGYAVAGAPFDATYTAQNNVSTNTPKFAGVPASTTPVTLKTTSSTAAADTTTVWYGVRVNASQATGTYTDTVTYTATTR